LDENEYFDLLALETTDSGVAVEVRAVRCPACKRICFSARELVDHGCTGDTGITAEYARMPIPVRSFDWAIWIDRLPDGPVGRGATWDAAVADLLEQMVEEQL
jgi:hypothetical protein